MPALSVTAAALVLCAVAATAAGQQSPQCAYTNAIHNIQCLGLSELSSNETAAGCAAAACTAGFATWLFCTDTSLCGELVDNKRCWGTTAACTGPPHNGWTGASVLPTPPPPSPPAPALYAIASASAHSPPPAGSPSWFPAATIFHFDTTAIPPSAAVPADSPLRDVFFAAPVLTAEIHPLNASASYALEVALLSDQPRTLALAAGDEMLGSITLEAGQPVLRRFNLTHTAVTKAWSVQELRLAITDTKGPNAVIANFTLFSSDPSQGWLSPLPPPAPLLPPVADMLPRLTPKTVAVGGLSPGSNPILSLNGVWNFSESAALPSNWTTILVPGEYTLQGHRIPAYQQVLYRRSVALPADWARALQQAAIRVKLRCDGVYSWANVSVNGAPAGSHLGGFTPFELDITDLLSPGSSASNEIAIAVSGASLADTLASGSKYAAHDLGGITRKIYLMATAPIGLAAGVIRTSFEDGAGYEAAIVAANVTVANDATKTAAGPSVVAATLLLDGKVVASASTSIPPLGARQQQSVLLTMHLATANDTLRRWDPEHPNLYTLQVAVDEHTVHEWRVGVREIRIVGNQILFNGRVLTNRGTTRHDTHPIWGRSLQNAEPQGQLWQADVQIFRDMNINWIRTSHYPPAEELMEAADELGMLIELESPFCWAANNGDDQATLNYTVQAQLEAIVFNINHPSVSFWSLGNESPWTKAFNLSFYTYVRHVDDTRPFMFDGGRMQPMPPLDILTRHYPGLEGPAHDANSPVPVSYGEYSHLNAYNRREILTDPGVRYLWGYGVDEMWELMWPAQGVVGGCFWAGIDDLFIMPSHKLVGYGAWGLIDNWRRAKPETFITRRMYAPVRVHIPRWGERWTPPMLAVDNRHDFTDLGEVSFTWEAPAAGKTGTGTASGPPRSTNNTLVLHGLDGTFAGPVIVNATSPRGFLIDQWLLNPAPNPPPPTRARATAPAFSPAPKVVPFAGGINITTSNNVTWTVEKSGRLTAVADSGAGAVPVVLGGPALMVLPAVTTTGQIYENTPPIQPFNEVLADWTATDMSWSESGAAVRVAVTGRYANASGVFEHVFDNVGTVNISFSFTWTQAAAVTPRQIGVQLTLPASFSTLSWSRNATWGAVYPDTDIGRPEGRNVPANPGPISIDRPAGCYSQDQTPLGTNDFRATRQNVYWFSLAPTGGVAGAVHALSDGQNHARAWVDADAQCVRMLAATLSNEGANPFSRSRVLPRPNIMKGAVVSGVVTFAVV